MQIHNIYSWFVSKLSSNGVIDTEFCIFSFYGRCAFPFLSPDSMTQHVHPLSEHRLLNQLWRHQERNKCNTATMPALWDVRGNTDSTCSFSRQLFTWEKQQKISQFNHGDAMHLSKNIFCKIQLPPTTPSQAGWGYPWGWFGRRPSMPISSDTYSVCSCNLGESALRKLQCQIVLKTCPFHLLSGYCTQMKRGFLSLEHKMQEKHRRHQQLKALGCPRQAGSRTSVSSWGKNVHLGNEIFAQLLQHVEPLKTGCEKGKVEGKNLLILGHKQETCPSQLLFEFASSCKVLPISKVTPF